MDCRGAHTAKYVARLLVVLAALSILAWITPALADRRVALVIGNSRYASVARLDNPPRDAAAVAAALREDGFETVQTESDLGREAMIGVLRRFANTADTAAWAVIYFAGHGLEVGGVNYLVPVDARLGSDRDVQYDAVPLDLSDRCTPTIAACGLTVPKPGVGIERLTDLGNQDAKTALKKLR